MDSVSSSPEGDWVERKELEKNARYGIHIYFINHFSALHVLGTVHNPTSQREHGATCDFQDRLRLLGVTNPKAREKIRALTVSKTLALSDIILKPFHLSILRSPEWALSSLPTELANSQTAALKLFKKITGPFSGLVI